MRLDQEKWDRRYLETAFPSHPDTIVKSYFHLAEKGKALDLACGNGRNSLFLRKNGFDVEGVDISTVAIEIVKSKDEGINAIHEDLDTFKIPMNRYSLIININFLQRRLFPFIIDGLVKNGVLIFKTFLEHSVPSRNAEPDKRDQYLKVNELLRAFLPLRVLHYVEERVTIQSGERREVAALVARKSC